jgi:hypothetical protein
VSCVATADYDNCIGCAEDLIITLIQGLLAEVQPSAAH